MATSKLLSGLQELPSRPVLRRGAQPPLPQRCNFATEALMRLALLAGLVCPNCGKYLIFDGKWTRCEDDRTCGYAWNKPDTAENEIYFGLS